ncbi:hypothetical protein J2Z21_008270 [Streptomyces griseochromogenes]|uniref:MOSC domain-containing protein n=1 Tax=Streptomyces griseochromogenes TaxID=68214 RepID=A0ABS4M6F3_9ACTN|nr:hypothetical protein [Streptomyces griseochromogenes]
MEPLAEDRPSLFGIVRFVSHRGVVQAGDVVVRLGRSAERGIRRGT